MDSLPQTPNWRRYLRFWRADVAADVDDELRFHLDSRAEELVGQGHSRDAAAAQALAEMGNLVVIRDGLQAIDRRVLTRRSLAELFGGFGSDLGYAIRRLRQSPGFTIAATTTLAIAIGATASVFGIVDGVLLKAFPYRNPGDVLTLWESNPSSYQPKSLVAPATYFDWRSQNTTFADLAAVGDGWQFTVTGAHDAEIVPGQVVTPSFFRVMGITPMLGRALSPDDGGPPTEVVISYGYWLRRFGGSPQAIGQVLQLDNGDDQSPPPRRHSYTVVGVMPPGLPGSTEMWVRLYFEAREHVMHNIRYLNVYGRLKRGVTPSAGVQDLRTVAARLAATYPETNSNWTVAAVPLLEQILGSVKPALIAMLAAAACVLLIGAANLANLFLVRYLGRERELAVRAALGATRRRLMHELVVEAGVLGAAAGALGVGIAVVGVRALRTLAPPTLPRLNDVGVDWRVMAFCAATSVVTVLVFGVLPAWRTTRSDLVDYLKAGGRTTDSAASHRLQNGLVVLQVAVALVLLSGAGLMVQSFERFLHVNPGFQSEGVLTAHIFFGGERYAAPQPKQLFVTNLIERLAATPGIEAAAVSSWIPAWAQAAGTGPLPPFHVIGDLPPDSAHAPGAILAGVSPGYFRLMGIPLLRGREFLSSDDSRAPHIVVIDDLLARRFFAGRDPIGERLLYSFGTDTLEIVGVVGSVKSKGLAADDVPFMYGPIAQRPAFKALFAIVRTADDPDLATQPLKRVIASLDPLMPVSEIRSEKALLVDTVGTTRFASVLASLFAGVALILGAIGIYSVLAYIVAQSRRQIAVRIALGARATQVVAGVVHRGLFLAGTGILIGCSAAWFLARGLASAFPGVTPRDPVIFVGAASAFAVTAVLAATIPAFRTTRVNPVAALSST